LYRNFDDGKKTLVSEVPINAANLEGFIRSYKQQSISELTPDTYKEFFSKDSEFMILICQELKCQGAKDIFTRFAIQNRNKMRFIYGFSETPIGGHLMRFLDVNSEEDLPVIRVIRIKGREVLKYKPDLNEKIMGSYGEDKIMVRKQSKETNVEENREEKMKKKLKDIRVQKGYGKMTVFVN
jgi:hypothetical protein